MDALKMCLNWKVVAALAAVAVSVAVVVPGLLVAALPLLLLAACPLSMLLMMGAMGGKKADREATSGASVNFPDAAGTPATADPTELRTRLAALEAEQATLARTIADLEAQDARPHGEPEAVVPVAGARRDGARGAR